MTDKLLNIIQDETAQPAPKAALKLAEHIKSRADVEAVLFYGSGLWSKSQGADPQDDTIYDFYVLVDRFRDFDDRRILAGLGQVLPPNVYYIELEEGAQTYRAKVAVMTLAQFERDAKGQGITPQIWARFAQPCRILYARDERTGSCVQQALADAVITFHRKTAPYLDNKSEPRDIWQRGLQQTYRAELRSERPERIERLYDSQKAAFEKRTRAVQPSGLEPLKSPPLPLQKAVAFVRLLKTTMTFENSVDYALWKIARQSGVQETATDFQKRYPLLAGWPVLWRLWRKGALR